MSKFIKIPTNEPDGELIVFLSNISLERLRLDKRLLYKVVIGPKDSRSIKENTYNELKHMLLNEKIEAVKKVEEIKVDKVVEQKEIKHTMPQVKETPKKQEMTPLSYNPTRKPTINTRNVPKTMPSFRR